MKQSGKTGGPNRRAVLTGFSATVIAGREQAMPPAFPVGVQLWTLDAALRENLDGGLAALRSLGVTAVETAGLYGHSAESFAAALSRAGLTCLACHAPQSALRGDPQRQIDNAAALGARHLVCASPQPSHPVRAGADWAEGIAEAMSLADWKRTADLVNRVGLACAPSGLRAAYHNHAFEFTRYDGRRALDVIVGSTDAGLVDLELDVGWTFAAGADPVSVMRSFNDRIRLLHLKDLRPDGQGGWRSRPLGSGVIDWPPVLRAARELDIDAAFVEQDPPFDVSPLESLRASLAFLGPPAVAAT
ncbi:sugar phosphate isomerase/epimerase family protein [Brevundimonas sp.]|uniref:sugar phosphate isomerase/epimerase family protein n=1 Tax=Brevundimonas sp. TaxID=1871086 RepID=UPI003A94B702